MKTVDEIRNYIDDIYSEIPYNDYSHLIDMVREGLDIALGIIKKYI